MKKASTMSAKLIGTREATMERITSESTVNVTIKLDGTGKADISTTVPFYDHMLTSLARHSLMDITIKAHGDTDIDVHHTVEDTAITLGEVFKTALGDKRGITRFGQATIPLDEALARCIVDLSGRPYVVHEGEPEGQQYHLIGGPCPATSANPSPPTQASASTSMFCAVAPRTTSSNARSRHSHAHCAKPSNQMIGGATSCHPPRERYDSGPQATHRRRGPRGR